MWRAIKASVIGIVIGLVCGALYVGVQAVEKMYSIVKKEETVGYSENIEAFNNILQGDSLESYTLSQLGILFNEAYEKDLSDDKAQSENASKGEDVIRISVEYAGSEALSDSEKEQLEQYVETAVLYGISEKLGEDYNLLDKATVRNKLIMSIEYINACAAESAEEWGIFITAKSTFDYIYMSESKIDDDIYPAGYYETLCITLS